MSKPLNPYSSPSPGGFSGGGGTSSSHMGARKEFLVAKGFPSKSRFHIQNVSATEIKERRDKRLCYYCNKKWNPTHKCRKAKLFIMEGMQFDQECDNEEEGSEEQTLENEGIEIQNLGVEAPKISLHAIASPTRPRTMRVLGKIRGQTNGNFSEY